MTVLFDETHGRARVARANLPSMTNAPPSPFQSRFYSAPDGLKLHLRDFGPRGSSALPVVCLPGLARTAADFDRLATAIADGRAGEPRRVVAIDYRGRGLSDRDPNWKNYDIFVESADIQTMLAATGIEEAIFVGTSRGGLHTMVLSATRPALLRAVVLNDIGPIIEPLGLARIRGYVGKLPTPNSWADAVDLFKMVAGAQFTGLQESDWEEYARLTFEEKDGKFATRYDPMLTKALEAMDIEAPLPKLWPQFEGLRNLPLLVIRGENSDLLSPQTLDEMIARHPGAEAYTVPGQGHAPLLLDVASIERICAFIAAVPAPHP
jgi:pimeloyl-ACP methyl ester carboxylesterase